MSITKTNSGTYRLRIYVPEEVRPVLGIKGKLIEKRFKTRKEARKFELNFQNKIDQVLEGETVFNNEKSGDILFSDFYSDVWWNAYCAGQTTTTSKPPTKATIDGTAILFRKHLIPMFGNYSLNFLNNNKEVVLNLMTTKAMEYANFKTLKSYVNSIFDWAEELEYIEVNKISKSIKRIKAIKKIKLREAKNDEHLYLSKEQLAAWLNAVKGDLDNGYLSFKDYALFFTTFFLSDRKSETYALQWKHINFDTHKVSLVQALDRHGNIKSTKGNKSTIFKVSQELIDILKKWKELQKEELSKFNIIPDENQFVFTYIDTQGNINKRLHIDYLNYRMQSIEKRHPTLIHATPHKLRHTGATLAKQAGASLELISEALTHSDQAVTQIYVNSANNVPMSVGEIAHRSL